MTLSAGVRELLLAFADDELLMGHRHSQWLGVAPFLEEDLAFASIAQDELGHARALYGLLTDDIDRLAFRRSPQEYRSCWLVELPAARWEQALVRHFLYDWAERVRWEALRSSTVPGLAGIAAKALREEEYHQRHATPLLRRMVQGTEDSARRVGEAMRLLLPVALGLFHPTAGEEEAVAEGACATPAAAQAVAWRARIEEALGAMRLVDEWPVVSADGGGRRGVRSEHFAGLHAVMTEVLALDPNAAW